MTKLNHYQSRGGTWILILDNFYLALSEMAQPQRQQNLAIFAYYSLLSDPGEKIVPHIIDRIPYASPLFYASLMRSIWDKQRRSSYVRVGNFLHRPILEYCETCCERL